MEAESKPSPVLHTAAESRPRVGDRQLVADAWRRITEQRERTLPGDDHELQRARLHLAAAKFQLGDLRGAHELQVRALEVVERTLGPDESDTQWARSHLADTKRRLGRRTAWPWRSSRTATSHLTQRVRGGRSATTASANWCSTKTRA